MPKVLWRAGYPPIHEIERLAHFGGRGVWRRLRNVRKERPLHILVSVAHFGLFPEEIWDTSVSWVTPMSPFPPCSSLGQKGR